MQVRKKVFETNSSSSHAVVVDEGTDFITEDFPKEIIITGGEFGWGYDKLTSWRERASYAYTYAKNSGRQKDIDLLKKVIEGYTKSKVVFEKLGDEYHEDGYIDHQSTDTAEEIFESEEKIKQVIFGRGSHIVIDNDNH